MNEIRVADTVAFKEAAKRGHDAGFNRQVPDEVLEALDPDGRHVVQPLMVHKHIAGELAVPHLRCRVLMKIDGSPEAANGIVDFASEDVEALSLASVQVPA